MVLSVDTRAHPLKTLFEAFPRILLLARGFDRRCCYNVRDLGVRALVVDIVRSNPIQYHIHGLLETLAIERIDRFGPGSIVTFYSQQNSH